MAYYYVKSGGTATGDAGRYASQQTGTFASIGASGYYDNITAAFGATTSPTSGDFVCVSNSHSHDYGAANQQWSGPSSGAFLSVITVDDSNCDQAAVATAFQEDCSWEFRVSGRVAFYGFWYKTDDKFRTIASDSQFILSNCVLEVTATNDYPVYFGNDNCHVTLINSEIKGIANGDWAIRLFDGCSFEMYGGKVTGITDSFVDGPSNYGGANLVLSGVDLSPITGHIVSNIGGAAIDQWCSFGMYGCRVSASLTGYWDEPPLHLRSEIVASNSAGASAGGEYQYHVTRYGGAVDDETSIYRDGSTAFPDSTQKISLKAVTTSAASVAAPFWFDFPSRYAELSTAASDNLTLYMLTSATLDDNEVWAEVIYPDGTSKHLYNFLSSANSDPLAAGTTLTTNTEAWTGRTTENRYQIDLDTSTDAGADCVPIIRVYVAKASTTIYFCPTIGLS